MSSRPLLLLNKNKNVKFEDELGLFDLSTTLSTSGRKTVVKSEIIRDPKVILHDGKVVI